MRYNSAFAMALIVGAGALSRIPAGFAHDADRQPHVDRVTAKPGKPGDIKGTRPNPERRTKAQRKADKRAKRKATP